MPALPLDTLLVLKSPQVNVGGQVYYTTTYVSLADFLSSHVLHENFVENIVNNVLDGTSYILVASDIAGRNMLNPTRNSLVWVLDATGDATVASGGAAYVYRLSTNSYTKVSEFESMDVVLQWANIQNKPIASVANIDDAVDKRHGHTNSAALEFVSEDAEQQMQYRGSFVKTGWSVKEW